MTSRPEEKWRSVAALAASVLCVLLPPALAHASEATASAERVRTVAYKEFHDPGVMTLVDDQGREVEISEVYSLIGYDEIAEWKEGEELHVVWKRGAGAGIVRAATGAFYKLPFTVDAEHPISVLTDRCTERETSTAGIAACLHAAAKRWDEEYEHLLALLQATASDARKADLAAADAAWSDYKTKLLAAQAHALEGGGTIATLERASLAVWLRQNRVRSLGWLW